MGRVLTVSEVWGFILPASVAHAMAESERLSAAVAELAKSNAVLTESNRELTLRLADQLDAHEIRASLEKLRQRADSAEKKLRLALAEKAYVEQEMTLSGAQRAAKRQDDLVEGVSSIFAKLAMMSMLVLHYLSLFDVGGLWYAVGPSYAGLWASLFLQSMCQRESRVFEARLFVAHTFSSWYMQMLIFLPGTIFMLHPICHSAEHGGPIHAAAGRCETAAAIAGAQVLSAAYNVVLIRALRLKPGSSGPRLRPFLTITKEMKTAIASAAVYSDGTYNQMRLEREGPYAFAAIHHERSNFAVPARLAIKAVHQGLRLQMLIECVVIAIAVGLLLAVRHNGMQPADVAHGTALVAFCTIGLLIYLALTREPVRAAFSGMLCRLALRGDAQRAAGVAALIGKQDIRSVLATARRTFTGVQLSQLEASHLAASTVDPSCSRLAVRRQMGEIDAFLSHSWHDDASLKWSALQRWGRAFVKESGGRPPVLWFDRCCIDQAGDIDAQLTSLPVFLAGCKSLLVLLGPSYTQRLWCVLEIFTFLTAGRTVDTLKLVPIGSTAAHPAGGGRVRTSELQLAAASSRYAVKEEEAVEEEGEAEEEEEGSAEWVGRALRSFEQFDVSNCRCSNEDHRQHLLGVIESGFGSFGVFNSLVRHLLSGEQVAKQIRQDAIAEHADRAAAEASQSHALRRRASSTSSTQVHPS